MRNRYINIFKAKNSSLTPGIILSKTVDRCSSGSSGRVRGGRETWNLCSRLWRPSFLWLIFTGPGGGRMAPRPHWIRYCGATWCDDQIPLPISKRVYLRQGGRCWWRWWWWRFLLPMLYQICSTLGVEFLFHADSEGYFQCVLFLSDRVSLMKSFLPTVPCIPPFLGYHLLLPPATKLGQGYIFTGVCDSVHMGGSASVHAGIPPPPPLGPGTPPPGAEHTGRYGQRAGGMHPTGMQSCFL